MRTMNWMRKIAAAAALSIAALLLASPVHAAVPYEGYLYDGYGDFVYSPVAYVPAGIVAGETLGIGQFRAPEDVFVTADKRIFIADTGNSRIVELNERYEFVRQIDKFSYEGKEEKFNQPKGVFVTPGNRIYVADTGNHRVIRLSGDGIGERIITAPKSEFFPAGFVFDPKKLAVDSAERVYVIADRVFDGIMQFNGEGDFENFYAANRVQYNLFEYMWKKYLSTSEQKQRMVAFVPTEYTNLDVDGSGFIFTTTAEYAGAAPKPIKRHNPTGADVLIRQGFANPSGDLRFPPSRGPSRLVDIDVGPDGSYSALDDKYGRIFTYSSEGKLLYIFGAIGDRVGTFQVPVSLDRVGDNIIVLDKNLHRLTLFRPTLFGKLVNDAVHFHYIGNEKKAAEVWKEVLTLDANLDIAYSGVSKAELREGDNRQAVEDAKLGLDRAAYSKAYERFRKEVLKAHSDTIMTTVLIVSVAWFCWTHYRNWKRRKGGASGVERSS